MPSIVASLCLTGLIGLMMVGLYGMTRTPRLLDTDKTLLICLGSGGHTTEMFQMLSSVDLSQFTRRIYYLSSGDTLSQHKAQEFEAGNDRVITRTLRRARRVKQSWWTTPYTAFLSFLDAARRVSRDRPDLLICNGPGTCVMLVLACLFLRVTHIKHCRIIFVESFARVKRLSLSGRILIHLVDRFLVMWPELAKTYPKAEYAGLLI